MTSKEVLQFLNLLMDKSPLLFLIGGLLSLVVFLFRILIDEDRSRLWRARISYAAYKLTGNRDSEKRYISDDVRSRINLARRKFSHGAQDPPKAVSVDWVDEEPGTTYDIGEGEFVVRLQSSGEQEKNIVDLAIAVTKRTTLPGVRTVMEQPLRVAVTLNLVQSILRMIKNKAALEWFFENRLSPILQHKEELRREFERIEDIDERGLFTHILLVELEEFGEVILGRTPRPYMFGDVQGLVDFLHRVATKRPGQNIPLEYRRAYIKIAIILVAKTERILNEGIEPYVKAMTYRANRDFKTVYVLGYDKEVLSEKDFLSYEEFRNLISQLDKELDLFPVQKDFSIDYSCIDQQGKQRKATCTRYILKDTSDRV